MRSLLTVELYLGRDLNDKPYPEAMLMYEIKKKNEEEVSKSKTSKGGYNG